MSTTPATPPVVLSGLRADEPGELMRRRLPTADGPAAGASAGLLPDPFPAWPLDDLVHRH